MSERNFAQARHGPMHACRRWQRARPVLLLCSILLASATWCGAGSGVYSAPVVFGWLLGLAAWLVVWWPAPRTQDRLTSELLRPAPFGLRALLLSFLLLALVIAIGAFFRFYHLAEVPHDPTSDHAEKLLDVLDLLHGQRPIFFPRNTGREPAQFYLALAMIRGFGFPFSWETLKWGTALVGLLAVPAVFLVGRELRGAGAGLIAATLFAIGKWPVNLSRAGLRYPLAILPAALTLWLLLRYLRHPDRRTALWCGVLIGAGLHGYVSFRIVPLLVPVVLGTGLIMDGRLRGVWRTVVADSALIAATALLACLPLARYSVAHPEQVWYRVATRAANAEQPLGGARDKLQIFARNNLRALLAFNVRGDATQVIAVSYDPLLDPVTGAAFVGGVVLAGYGAVRRRDPRLAALLLAIPVLLLPSTLSIAFPNENPSANRLGVAGVAVFPLAALPFALLLRLEWRRRVPRVLAGVALAGALLLAARHNYLRYFRDFDAQYRTFVPNTRDVADAIRERLDQGIDLDNVYVLSYPYWLDGRNIAFALGDIGWEVQHDVPADRPLPARKPGVPMLFVLNDADVERLDQLRHSYPDGYKELKVPPVGRAFVVYTVPPAPGTLHSTLGSWWLV